MDSWHVTLIRRADRIFIKFQQRFEPDFFRASHSRSSPLRRLSQIPSHGVSSGFIPSLIQKTSSQLRIFIKSNCDSVLVEDLVEKAELRKAIDELYWTVFDNLAAIARTIQQFDNSILSHIHATDHYIYIHQ